MGPISANIAPIKKIWGEHDRHGVVKRQFNGHRLLPRDILVQTCPSGDIMVVVVCCVVCFY
jgi:hypothetical protein